MVRTLEEAKELREQLEELNSKCNKQVEKCLLICVDFFEFPFIKTVQEKGGSCIPTEQWLIVI